MRRVSYYVIRIGDEWAVSCSLRSLQVSSHPDRESALLAAEAAAQAMWEGERVATNVRINEDDDDWHTTVEFGDLLG
jgi:hypothetical protein